MLFQTTPLLHHFLDVSAQVLQHLAALCIEASQQKAALQCRHPVVNALAVWLYKAMHTCRASPTSRLAASLRQQLQGSGLLQHMAAMLNGSADDLTAATAAACGESGLSSSISSSSTAARRVATKLQDTLTHVTRLLCVYHRACQVIAPTASFSLAAGLPAAPAAVRAVLTTFKTCSRVQQLAARDSTPAPVLLLAADAVFWDDSSEFLSVAFRAVTDLAQAVQHHSTDQSLHSLPGVQELLLCPELVPCLAVAILVEALGLVTLVKDKRAEDVCSSGRGAASSSSSSSSSQMPAAQGAAQQPAAAAAASSAGCHQTSSSSQISSSSVGLGIGLSQDGLTPLSCGLFGLLGVDQGVLVHCARDFTDDWNSPFPLTCLETVKVYCDVQAYQVSKQLAGSR